jgi:undecaprenyl pyrophosphate phosphatase UppP
MNDLLSSILQGIVEGLTEFLPVSSTAHILLVQDLLGTDRESPFWKMFAVVIQLGAILSVVLFFRDRLLGSFKSFLLAWKHTKTAGNSVNTLTEAANDNPAQSPIDSPKSKDWKKHPLVLVLLSFVVTALPCLVIDKMIGDNMESSLVIAVSLIIGADCYARSRLRLRKKSDDPFDGRDISQTSNRDRSLSNSGRRFSWYQSIDVHHHRWSTIRTIANCRPRIQLLFGHPGYDCSGWIQAGSVRSQT